jgi:hypothetical protein
MIVSRQVGSVLRAEASAQVLQRCLVSGESAETPKLSGLPIASLYSDPQLMSKSGSVVIASEAALEYRFKDLNGRQPSRFRGQKGFPRPSSRRIHLS